MERPVYANSFAVALNSDMNELVINFFQEYPADFVQTEEAGNFKVSAAREEIAGVVMPAVVARQLVQTLNTTLNQNPQAAEDIKTD